MSLSPEREEEIRRICAGTWLSWPGEFMRELLAEIDCLRAENDPRRRGSEMKLKEKLMREYVETKRGHQDQYAEILSEAFLAGFEKATELAKERLKGFTVRWGFESEVALGPKTISVNEMCVSKILDDLGEEEIEN